MARTKAAQAMQGPSRGSVHNSCASLTLFSMGTFFDWEGGGEIDNLGRKKASCVHEHTESRAVCGDALPQKIFFIELLGDRL